jgi:cobalt/nickel transport system permease protein
MHIPDGFIDLPTVAVTAAAGAAFVAVAVRKTGRNLGERTVPLLGVTAAFIFAAQMLNFPIAAGTSGHFLGGLLAAVLLGPWAANLALTAVLIVQALAMADGGITALGANVTNMAVIAVFAGYGAFLLLRRLLPRTVTGYLVSVAAASWVSVVLASVASAVELAVSGTIPLGTALPAMVSVHMVIGVGEALISAAVVSAVLAARPDLVGSFDLPRESIPRGSARKLSGRARLWSVVAAAFVVAAALALFVAPFASNSPDGLESVATTHGVDGSQAPLWHFSPLGDYHLPGIRNEGLSTALAGVIGTAAIFALVILAGRLLGRRRQTESS